MAYQSGLYDTSMYPPTNSTANASQYTISVSEYTRPVPPWPLPYDTMQWHMALI